MADRDQFEKVRGMEPGEAAAHPAARTAACAVCEAMLPEAVDGGLSAAEQRAFDVHVAGCVECAQELEEAQRGAAWLGMLKSKAPEPPAGLLAKILAETTGRAEVGASAVAAPMAGLPAHERAPHPAMVEPSRGWGTPAAGWGTSNTAWATPVAVTAPKLGARWAAARVSVGAMFSMESARSIFQPRLAMTAAMAFFSIALTLNLTGVRLSELRADNFTPSGVRRTVADAGASLSRSFQNNRVVYQVESRVSELRSDDAPNANVGPGETSR